MTPIVRHTGNRFSVNAMSAISTRGRMHLMVFVETSDAQMMCRFLARLGGHFDRKAHLIVDRHSVHRSKTVRAWLADHQDRIELHFLPSRSPEPNPDELVDADLKRSLPHTTGPGTRPNSPPKPAGFSTVDNVSHTSPAATSAARTSATPSTRTL